MSKTADEVREVVEKLLADPMGLDVPLKVRRQAADLLEAIQKRNEVLEGAVTRAAPILIKTTQLLGEAENGTANHSLPYVLKQLKIDVDLCIMKCVPIRECARALIQGGSQ